MQRQTLATDGADLAVRDSGGRGTPIVMLSGGPGMPDYLQEVARAIEGRRVVTYDQRGTGESSVKDGDYSVAAHVADLECLRRWLGADQVHLFGHSWGGLLAKLYATEHLESVASLFLCSPATGVGRDWAAMERATLRYNRQRCSSGEFTMMGVRALLGRIPGGFGEGCLQKVYAQAWLNFQRPERARPADRALVEGVGRQTAVKTRASAMALPAEHLDSVLPSAAVPMQIIFGDEDIFGEQSQRLASRYPNAQCEVWPGCGHLAWVDDEPRFRRALNEFYAGLS